ncbi:MAG: hypothetical protein ACI4TX_03920 [Christensenellales bacterium]
MKKKYLTTLCLMMVLVIGVFTGCTTSASNFSFKPSVTELNIILGETSTNTETIDNSVAFSVAKTNANADDGVWTSIQNESIVSVKRVSDNVLKTDFVVTGLMPGSAKIRINNLINSKDYKEIVVNVYQQIESVEFASDDDIYIPFGGTYSIKADTELNLSPIHSAKSDLRYEIVESIKGVTIDNITGVIDASQMLVAQDFTIKVYGKNNAENYDTKKVHIVKPISNDTISITTEDGQEIIKNGEIITDSIELVKTIEDLAYKNLIIECSDYSSDLLTVNIDKYDALKVQAEVKGNNVIRLQTVALGECELMISINLKNAENYLQGLSFSLKLNVVDIPNAININGEKVDGTKSVVVYDKYNDGILGEQIRFTVSPNSVLLDDSEIVVTYNDINAVNNVRFLNEEGNAVDVKNGNFGV